MSILYTIWASEKFFASGSELEKEDIRNTLAGYLIIQHLKNWKPVLCLKSRHDTQRKLDSKEIRM